MTTKLEDAMIKAITAWYEHFDNTYDGEPLKDYEIQMLAIWDRLEARKPAEPETDDLERLVRNGHL